MGRFKLSLSGAEMLYLGNVVRSVGSTMKALNIDELVRCEAIEGVYHKMARMYRPDKKKFTLRLSSGEACAMWNLLVVAMNCESCDLALISGSLQSLEQQIDKELSIYNYNRN